MRKIAKNPIIKFVGVSQLGDCFDPPFNTSSASFLIFNELSRHSGQVSSRATLASSSIVSSGRFSSLRPSSDSVTPSDSSGTNEEERGDGDLRLRIEAESEDPRRSLDSSSRLKCERRERFVFRLSSETHGGTGDLLQRVKR